MIIMVVGRLTRCLDDGIEVFLLKFQHLITLFLALSFHRSYLMNVLIIQKAEVIIFVLKFTSGSLVV